MLLLLPHGVLAAVPNVVMTIGIEYAQVVANCSPFRVRSDLNFKPCIGIPL
jgi:hypothetical protein